MARLETTVTRKILALLESKGAFVAKYHGNEYSLAGMPDIIACFNGRFIAIEVKKDEHEEPRRLQQAVMARIRASGGIAFHCWSVASCESALASALASADALASALDGDSTRVSSAERLAASDAAYAASERRLRGVGWPTPDSHADARAHRDA